MGQRVTLGGDRLGSGKKQKVDTKTFDRSTHDIGYVWRSTMSAGTLVPFMSEVVLPGDSIDIDLGCEVLTSPTVGPLFGSMKVQLDIFTAPVRLYNGPLHNNKLGIGMNMAAVKLPYMEFDVPVLDTAALTDLIDTGDIDNSQVNPSSILSYLGMRGFGIPSGTDPVKRKFNAVSLLAYWDIFKNYYSNKQEEDAWVIHSAPVNVPENILQILVHGDAIPQWPSWDMLNVVMGDQLDLTVSGMAAQPDKTIMIGVQNFGTNKVEFIPLESIFNKVGDTQIPTTLYEYRGDMGNIQIRAWRYKNGTDAGATLDLVSFPLTNIDKMRENILKHQEPTAFNIFEETLSPYTLLIQANGEQRAIMGSQEGLAVKTYQSDLFNNWLDTEYIDGVGGITEITSVEIVDNKLSIDSLILHKKVYEMLNDVLVAGGTYEDWQEVVYDHRAPRKAETPMYWGSLIKELQFQEVVSNAEANTATGAQPLGTLAGRGRLGQKHKGGNINIKVDEISYLIGIISITPRLDYSQGNEWHTALETMDDFHKPHLDAIGFQELITGQLAWWDTAFDTSGEIHHRSAGKQPAWINYQTNTNKVKGNFAVRDNSMFMVLARRYRAVHVVDQLIEIGDLTTYIDPRHFNHIFATTSLDSQHYWVQVGADITARRKMSARIMPHL